MSIPAKTIYKEFLTFQKSQKTQSRRPNRYTSHPASPKESNPPVNRSSNQIESVDSIVKIETLSRGQQRLSLAP